MDLGEIASTDLITKADATTPIPVASTNTVYTPSFPMSGVESVEFLGTSDGTVKVLCELEMSEVRPTTEESSDAEWREPDGLADLIELNDEVIHAVQLDVPKKKYGRIKMTGQAGNHASTTVRVKIHRREYP